jgi:lauroyl/myristoyl acyltransferase
VSGAAAARPVPPESAPAAGRCRARAAAFWLMVLFRLIAAAPWLARWAKPLFVRLAFTFSRKIRTNTDANARRIFGEDLTARQRRQFGLRVAGSFYDFVSDIGQSLRATRQQLAGRIESAEGHDRYRQARDLHKGAVILTAHMGSFEVGLVALSQAEANRIHVVFKRDQVGAFERLRTRLRRRLNVAEAPIDDGWPVWMRLREALLNDEVIAIQGDRVMPGQKGVRVPLLGGQVLLPTGPFKLALAAGSPVIPIFSIRTASGKVRIFIEDAIHPSADPDGIEQAARQFAGILAKYVARYPDQWLVLDQAFV